MTSYHYVRDIVCVILQALNNLPGHTCFDRCCSWSDRGGAEATPQPASEREPLISKSVVAQPIPALIIQDPVVAHQEINTS